MLIGHLAVGFAAKRCVPRESLATLLFGGMLVDYIWATLILVGIEKASVDPQLQGAERVDFYYQPYSHTLEYVLIYALLAGGAAAWMRRNVKELLPLAIVVASHWFLDALSHRPDLLVMPGDSNKVGFGLWNQVPDIMLVEIPLFLGCVWLYMRSTQAIHRQWPLYAIAILLVALQVYNYFSPPPSGSTELAIGVYSTLLIVVWARFIDRGRMEVDPAPAPAL